MSHAPLGRRPTATTAHTTLLRAALAREQPVGRAIRPGHTPVGMSPNADGESAAAASGRADAGGDATDDARRLSHDGQVLLVAGGAALVAAPVGAAAGAPTAAVLLAVAGGAVGVGAAAGEFAGRAPPSAAAHLGTGLPCLAAAALALRAGVVLSAAILALVGAMGLGPLYGHLKRGAGERDGDGERE